LKYPTIFNSADIAVITKMDLAAAVEFDEATALANIQAVRPGMKSFKLSTKSGLGMEEFMDYLAERRAEAVSAQIETGP
jgi:hydrogenase nickel incorporation protein HypB